MSATDSAAAILAGAKNTLQHANNFEASFGGNPPAEFTKKNEFSKASYKMAQTPKPKSAVEDIATGIKNRIEMTDKALNK